MMSVEISLDPVAVDLWIRKQTKEGKLKVACLFPFVTTVTGGVSTAGLRPGSMSVAASTLLRQAFYVGSNPTALRRKMQEVAQHAGLPASDPLLDLLGDIARFHISDKFEPF
jgi:hypothetical protein